MGKIVSLLIALSVAVCIILPELDFYAYFVNFVENFPPILEPLNETMDLVRDFTNKIQDSSQFGTSFSEALINIWNFLKILFEVLFVLPLRVIRWAVSAISVLFGGAI